jgi:hypothetical protein
MFKWVEKELRVDAECEVRKKKGAAVHAVTNTPPAEPRRAAEGGEEGNRNRGAWGGKGSGAAERGQSPSAWVGKGSGGAERGRSPSPWRGKGSSASSRPVSPEGSGRGGRGWSEWKPAPPSPRRASTDSGDVRAGQPNDGQWWLDCYPCWRAGRPARHDFRECKWWKESCEKPQKIGEAKAKPAAPAAAAGAAKDVATSLPK